jgi:hypothetical protein
MDFQTYLHKSWSEHAKDPQGVAEQFESKFALLVKPEDVLAFSQLISHVFIEHLCKWREGKQTLTKLLKLPLSEGASTQKSLQRSIATMDYLIGDQQEISQHSAADQVRILAASASGFAAAQDIAKAQNTLQKAVSIASANLEEKDPAYKPLAMAGNNLASQLEEKINRSAEETSLMLFAAETARTFWERAGTWLEVERAEYRLAHSHLAAGNIAIAIRHAELCQKICEQNSADAMEMFFVVECFAKIYLKQDRRDDFAKALQQMENHLSKLNREENPWCVRALENLKAEGKR